MHLYIYVSKALGEHLTNHTLTLYCEQFLVNCYTGTCAVYMTNTKIYDEVHVAYFSAEAVRNDHIVFSVQNQSGHSHVCNAKVRADRQPLIKS